MTQPNPPESTGDSEVSATWLKEQFGSFATRLQKMEENLTNLPNVLKPAASSSPPNPPQTQAQPPANQAQVTQPAEGGNTQKPKGPRSVLRIGTIRVK